jgi:hypothetical protein
MSGSYILFNDTSNIFNFSDTDVLFILCCFQFISCIVLKYSEFFSLEHYFQDAYISSTLPHSWCVFRVCNLLTALLYIS